MALAGWLPWRSALSGFGRRCSFRRDVARKHRPARLRPAGQPARLRPARHAPSGCRRKRRPVGFGRPGRFRRDVSPPSVPPVRLRPAVQDEGVPGFPVRPSRWEKAALPIALAGVSRPQALREEPRLRPPSGGAVETRLGLRSSGCQRRARDVRVAAPAVRRRDGSDALRGRFADRGLSSDPDIPRALAALGTRSRDSCSPAGPSGSQR